MTCFLFAYACNEDDTYNKKKAGKLRRLDFSEKILKKDSKSEKETAHNLTIPESSLPDIIDKKTDPQNTEPINISDIQEGDEIKGLIVKTIQNKAEYTEFAFEGEITLSGTIYKNPMNYTNEFKIENCKTKLLTNQGEKPLFSVLTLTNFEALQEKLSKKQQSQIANGQTISVSITIKNPSTAFNFGRKGRLSHGSAEFVAVNPNYAI